ncbi:hypothetical protein PLESTM_001414700 [Pleodorina starrii]|nr:hypothetical protein PLESTM_001414700 [Pleodorina starrii]
MDDSQDLENEEFCYICFEGATRGPSGEVEPLVQVCRCPTRVHRRCVARWQLYSAGRREEKSCRFCQDTLPDWKEVLTPRSLPPAVPVLSIYYNNTCCRMKVRPGPDGLQAFLRQLQAIVGRDVANVNFVFRCRCPDTGAEIFLQGLQAFEAAMHCACVRAAQRSLLQQQQQQQQALLLQEQQQQQQQQALLLQQQQQQRERQQQGSQVLLQHHHQQNQQLLPQQMRPATGAHYLPYTSLTAAAAAAAAQGPQLRRASAPNERMFDAVPTHIGPSSAVLGSTAAAAVAATRPPALDLLGSPFDSPPQLAGSMNRSSPPYILDGGGRDAATTGLAAASQCAGPSEGCSGAFIAASAASADATACAAAVGPAAAAAATLDLSPPPPPPPASQFSPPSSPQTTTTTPQSRTPPTPQSPPPPPPPGHWHPHLPGSTSQLTAAAPRALYGSIPPLLLGGGGTVVRPDVATAGNSSSRTTSSRAASLTIASTETAKLTEAAAVAPQAAAAAVCAASAPEPLMRHVSPDVSPPPPAPLPLPPLGRQLGSFGGRADGGLAPAAASAGPHRSAASQPAATSGAASSSPSPFPSPPSSSSSLAASARASGQPPLLRETAGSQPWPSRAGVGRCLGRGGGGGGDVGRTGGEKTRAAVLLSRKVDSVLAAVKSFKSALARKFAPRRVAG